MMIGKVFSSMTLFRTGLLFGMLLFGTMISKVTAGGNDYERSKKKLGVCQTSCKKDYECAEGLWCAEQHSYQLQNAGFDRCKANCGNVGGWGDDVCFDPRILGIRGGAGGDPHFTTFDGTKYSYHGVCDLVLVRSKHHDIDVHIRTTMHEHGFWSYISTVAIRFGTDIIEITNDGQYDVNGMVNVPLPYTLGSSMGNNNNNNNSTKTIVLNRYDSMVTPNSNDEKVATAGNNEAAKPVPKSHYVIDLGNNESIGITLLENILTTHVSAFWYDAEGLLGIHTKPGMIGRDHTTTYNEHTVNDYGAQWQVTDNEQMLFEIYREPQYPVQCIVPDAETSSRRQRHLRSYTNTDYNAAKEACASVTDQETRTFCIEDVLVTGSLNIAHIYQAGEVFGPLK